MKTEKLSGSSEVGSSTARDWSPVTASVVKKYELERELQTDIFKEFGARGETLRIWRQNTGMAYGYSQVKSNVALLLYGKFELAMKKFKQMQPTRYGVPGMPDIFGILTGSGRFLAIEAKMFGREPDEDQIAWRTMFESKGGLYILAFSVDDVYRGLRGAGINI